MFFLRYKTLKLMFFISLICTQLQAKERELEIFEPSVNDKVKVRVDEVTGQYRLEILPFLQASYQIADKEAVICEYIESEISKGERAFETYHNSLIKTPVTWKIFHNFKNLPDLEESILKELKQNRAFQVKKLTNLTAINMERLEVLKVSFGPNSIVAKHDLFITAADEELKNILAQQHHKAHQNGQFSTPIKFSPLFCDLAKGEVKISFKLKGYQSEFPGGVSPLKSLLSATEVKELSEKLANKTKAIEDQVQKNKSQFSSLDARLLLSSAHLAQLLMENNISIDKLKQGEFLDLTAGLVTETEGLPKKLSFTDAAIVSESLFREKEHRTQQDFEYELEMELMQ